MKPLWVTMALGLALTVAEGTAAAQDPFDNAKAQYAAAAYEEALASLAKASELAPSQAEVEQYRALCLIALGRMDDAERAVAALVEADPAFVPSPNVASPRVLSVVADMRARELPAIARRLLETGREAFQAKDFVRAQRDLGMLLDLLKDESLQARPETADLRTLAEGFTALAAERAAEDHAAGTTGVAPGPAPAASSPSAASSMPDSGATLPAASTSGSPPSAPAGPPPAAATLVLTEPEPVVQAAPAWIPPNSVAGSREYNGAIRVRIGPDGRVKSAEMEQPTYPTYDMRLLAAAREWIYKPATRNGIPVDSERVIPIQLKPRDE